MDHLIFVFLTVIFALRLGILYSDVLHFERRCIEDQFDDVLGFRFFLEPFLLFCVLLALWMTRYFGMAGLFLTVSLFFGEHLIQWMIAMWRYSFRPDELKHPHWRRTYLLWIIALTLISGSFLSASCFWFLK